jgi:hypothetical protein
MPFPVVLELFCAMILLNTSASSISVQRKRGFVLSRLPGGGLDCLHDEAIFLR